MPGLHEAFGIHVSLSIGLLGLIYVALIDRSNRYRILEWTVFIWPMLLLVGLVITVTFRGWDSYWRHSHIDLWLFLKSSFHVLEVITLTVLTWLIFLAFIKVRKRRAYEGTGNCWKRGD